MAYREAYKLYWDRACLDVCDTIRAIRPNPITEGLALTLLRVFWIPFVVFHLLVFWSFATLLGCFLLIPFGWLSWNIRRIHGMWSIATDVYCCIWTYALIVCYLTAHDALSSVHRIGNEDWNQFCVNVPGAVAIFRLYEICSFIGALYAKRIYTTFSKERAVLNTFWHYIEAIIAFATIYICVAYLYGDPFGTIASADQQTGRNLAVCKGAIAQDQFTSLYFSTITIATVGYGDHAPQTFQGRIVVVAEIFYGLFLLVVVIQRAMGARELSADGTVSSCDPVRG